MLEEQQPNLVLEEKHLPGLGTQKVGDQIRVLATYEVIEKTKSFCVLKINSVSMLPTRRML